MRRALQCAVDMQIAMDERNRGAAARTVPELYMGIGINTGKVIAGLMGSEIYSARTSDRRGGQPRGAHRGVLPARPDPGERAHLRAVPRLVADRRADRGVRQGPGVAA